MKRRLLNLLTALSLLLCVAVVALWVRSYWARDALSYTAGRNQYGMSTFPGGFHFGRDFFPEPPSYLRNGWSFDSITFGAGFIGDAAVTWEPEQHDWSRWGFGASYQEFAPHDTTPAAIVPRAAGRPLLFASWAASVPSWFLVSLTMILPAIQSTRALRARARRRRQQCPSCGYDLRATPGRCPECGTSAVNWQI